MLVIDRLEICYELGGGLDAGKIRRGRAADEAKGQQSRKGLHREVPASLFLWPLPRATNGFTVWRAQIHTQTNLRTELS